MIDKEVLKAFVESQLEGSPYFLTDLKVTESNDITVEIDSLTPGDIEECVKLTRAIEDKFDRDVEDYQLEVGTAGLTSPLKVKSNMRNTRGRISKSLPPTGKTTRHA